MNKLTILLVALMFSNCNSNSNQAEKNEPGPATAYKQVGRVELLDPALDAIIDTNAQAEIIAEGMDWSEGPVWVESQQMLLFSDVPRDTIYKWTEKKGKEVYLTPSGYTGQEPRGGEMGSNGLTLDKNGNLVLCQCGNRQMARMDAPLDKPAPIYTSLANQYKGKKFNTPNDAVYNTDGDLFFTDPAYGLEKQMDDPKKELPYQGVFQVRTNGEVLLVTDTLTRPNGIAFFPGDNTMLVANSDPARPHWYAFDRSDKNTYSNGHIFLTASGRPGEQGLPDGMKINKNGIVFATGPGGIWIFNQQAKVLGRFLVPGIPTSNCAFSADQKTLYITNDMNVLRLKLK